jgi:protein-tyrosine phosphatase
MMTVELVLFIAILGFFFNVITLWALTKIQKYQEKTNSNVWRRLNYLEVGMSHHGLIPMPWEVEEIEEIVEEIKTFREEGNVVYLQKEE